MIDGSMAHRQVGKNAGTTGLCTGEGTPRRVDKLEAAGKLESGGLQASLSAQQNQRIDSERTARGNPRRQQAEQ